MSVLGIDFGTSTSVFCGLANDRLDVLKDAEGEDIIPSIVAFTPTGKVSIGRAAKKRTLIDPVNTLYSMKRLLGRPWHDPDVASFRKQYPFELERGDDGPQFVTRAGKLSVVDVVTRFLAHARQFPSIMQHKHERVVIAVPELASEKQRRATLEAAQGAGFVSVDLVSEPVSAALAFLYKEPEQGLYLVFDLGGGTFDAAVVRWNGLRPAVLATSGDSYLGGDDIDRALTDWAAGCILREHRWDVKSHQPSHEILRFLCEQAKVSLSVTESTILALESVDQVLAQKTLKIQRTDLEPIYDGVLQKALRVADNAVAQSGYSVDDLVGIFLVGGTTYSPFVRAKVTEHFKRPVHSKLPPDRVVAMGAALLAGIRARAV